ncbi:MAG TPA: hypothetical protein VK898_13700 [Chloroflexota bacterium]|nr:hypothetical protein [Chloroflexota bacterium]
MERQARRFAYQWFRRHHRQASEAESHDFAAGRWQEFIAQAQDALPEDEPVKLVDWSDSAGHAEQETLTEIDFVAQHPS